MTKMDGRRRRYVPVDVDLARKRFGTRLIDEWGMSGIGAWVLLLAAAKRDDEQGTFQFANEVEAWAKLGCEPESFTFAEFLTFCGRNKQTRKTRSGRLITVEIVNWETWNTRFRGQQKASTEQQSTDRMPPDYDGNAKKYGQNAPPEAEAEVEGEYEGEVEPLLLSIDKKIEVKKLMQAVTGAKANSWRQVEQEAAGVSLASIVRVRESCERKRPRPGVGYAVAALRSEAGAA